MRHLERSPGATSSLHGDGWKEERLRMWRLLTMSFRHSIMKHILAQTTQCHGGTKNRLALKRTK